MSETILHWITCRINHRRCGWTLLGSIGFKVDITWNCFHDDPMVTLFYRKEMIRHYDPSEASDYLDPHANVRPKTDAQKNDITLILSIN